MSESLDLSAAALTDPLRAAAVANLLTRYVAAIDRGDYEAWPEFFTETCHYQIISRESVERGWSVGMMLCDSRGMLRDRIRALREINVYEPHSYRHVTGPIEVLAQGPEAWSLRSNYILTRTMFGRAAELFNTGCYQDEVVFEPDNSARFRRREVICDSSIIDTLVVIPF
jgi:anthranilate 1,2-dioxygenase small subunit